VIVDRTKKYQLRVGMDGERDLEFIPLYQSAYAQRIALKANHATREEAHRERDTFIEWLRQQTVTC
jgi:hypothetical protein